MVWSSQRSSNIIYFTLLIWPYYKSLRPIIFFHLLWLYLVITQPGKLINITLYIVLTEEADREAQGSVWKCITKHFWPEIDK